MPANEINKVQLREGCYRDTKGNRGLGIFWKSTLNLNLGPVGSLAVH